MRMETILCLSCCLRDLVFRPVLRRNDSTYTHNERLEIPSLTLLEPPCKKTSLAGFQLDASQNGPVQSQRQARGLKYRL